MNRKKQDNYHNKVRPHIQGHAPAISASTDNYQLALTQIRNGQYHDATLTLRKCLSLDPDFTEAHIRLSGIYQHTGQIEKSDKHLRVVLSNNPDHVEALVKHGSNLVLSGNIADAHKCFEKAIGLKPDSAYIAASLAGLHIRKGNPHEALKIINPFLTGFTVHDAIAVVFADICKHLNRCEEATILLEEIVQRSELQNNGRRNALFQLGKLYDASNNYKKAFECFSEANSLKHSNFNIEELKN